MSSVTTMSQFGTPAGASAAIIPRRRSSLITKCSPAAPVKLVALTIPPPVESNGAFLRPNGQQLFRSEEHTSELQSLMRISSAVFCLKKPNYNTIHKQNTTTTTHY